MLVAIISATFGFLGNISTPLGKAYLLVQGKNNNLSSKITKKY
jgi:hypothetical protein